MATGDAVFKVFLGVSNVCFKYFIWVFQMLQWLYTHVARVYMFHVASVCFKCFSYFIRTFHVFHLDVAEVYLDVAEHACCNRMF